MLSELHTTENTTSGVCEAREARGSECCGEVVVGVGERHWEQRLEEERRECVRVDRLGSSDVEFVETTEHVAEPYEFVTP